MLPPTGVLALLVLVTGCAATNVGEAVFDAGAPWSSVPGTVGDVTERFGYLDGWIDTERFELRFLFPDSAECRQVLKKGQAVDYTRLGPLGRVTAGETRCEPLGVASLDRWRSYRPRGRARKTIPRAQATFTVIHRDEAMSLARGRFPLAAELGLAGGQDMVALIPNSAACREPLERGVASMEYRRTGDDVLVLLGQQGRCRIRGLAQPIPGT